MLWSSKPLYLKSIRFIFLAYLFFILGFVQRGYAIDDEASSWQNYQKWFEYKKSRPLNQFQRDVVLYFEKANLIFERADDTWGASRQKPNLPNPQDALNIVDKCFNEFSRLETPVIAKKHYAATLKLLEVIKKYHLKREDDPNSDELGQLAGDAIPYESIQSSEYFKIMQNIGLMDNVEEEWIQLGLMDRADIEREYSFSKKYKRNEPVACLKCGGNMKRVKILHEGDREYENAIKNNPGDFLFGGNGFEGAPEFGYICVKCSMWYEEYPTKNTVSIIIRNWGWGWHELVYKKQSVKVGPGIQNMKKNN